MKNVIYPLGGILAPVYFSKLYIEKEIRKSEHFKNRAEQKKWEIENKGFYGLALLVKEEHFDSYAKKTEAHVQNAENEIKRMNGRLEPVYVKALQKRINWLKENLPVLYETILAD